MSYTFNYYRCTLMSECSLSQHSTDRWKIVKDGSKECTAINSISPQQASSTEDITVNESLFKFYLSNKC